MDVCKVLTLSHPSHWLKCPSLCGLFLLKISSILIDTIFLVCALYHVYVIWKVAKINVHISVLVREQYSKLFRD